MYKRQKPEFDAWRWNAYWVALESVVEFKRDVYRKALSELSRYLFTDPALIRPPYAEEQLDSRNLPG